jgi:uncharacterized integral membrane protein (TIGR00698 family)
VPLGVGVLCVLTGGLVAGVSPVLLALVLGAVATNLPVLRPMPEADVSAPAKTMLRWGIVLIGLRLPLGDLLDVGVAGLAVIVATVVTTFVITCWVGDRLGLERGLVTLVATGFSICGATAIAAVEGVVRRRDEDAALAVAMVTLFGTAMVVLLPLTAGALDLSDHQLGVWAGASIHEVAQVVAAAAVAGPAAVAVATTLKLGRVVMLVGAYAAARARACDAGPEVDESEAPAVRPGIPWFVTGFLLTVVVRSLDVLPDSAYSVADDLTTVFLGAGMFGLGLGLRLVSLLPVPGRLLVLCTLSTLTAAGVSGVLTVTLFT